MQFSDIESRHGCIDPFINLLRGLCMGVCFRDPVILTSWSVLKESFQYQYPKIPISEFIFPA